MKKRIGMVAVLVSVASVLAVVLWLSGPPPDQTGEEDPAGETSDELPAFLAGYRGRLLLLLLGREDCPGTTKATAVLDAYAPHKAEAVTIVRLDVPLPNERLKVGPWKHPYPRRLDEGRQLAQQLDFFFYPTLYLFDSEGELRYTGGCDEAGIRTMVNEILVERPGQPKKHYTLPMPGPGDSPPHFAGETLTGGTVTLKGLQGRRATLLIFARTSCRFTVEALAGMNAVARDFHGHAVATVIINDGEEKAELQRTYAKHGVTVPVVWDQRGKVSLAYGVDVTPFFFLLDESGRIATRRSYTHGAARNALNSLLGLAAKPPRYESTKAG